MLGLRRSRGPRFAALLLLALLTHGCSAAKQPAITQAPTGTELPGKFVWHDLLTSDPAAAQRFYAGLFGWEFQQPDSGEYTVVTQAGRPIGGILDTHGGKTERVPAQWLGSLSVPDVDSAVGVVKSGGGKLHWGPKSLGPRGDVALVADAHNAPFVVMRSPQGDPPDATPAMNGWLWNELWTPDPEAAARFYERLVSYQVKTHEDGDRAYYVLGGGRLSTRRRHPAQRHEGEAELASLCTCGGRRGDRRPSRDAGRPGADRSDAGDSRRPSGAHPGPDGCRGRHSGMGAQAMKPTDTAVVLGLLLAGSRCSARPHAPTPPSGSVGACRSGVDPTPMAGGSPRRSASGCMGGPSDRRPTHA